MESDFGHFDSDSVDSMSDPARMGLVRDITQNTEGSRHAGHQGQHINRPPAWPTPQAHTKRTAES